MILNWASFQGHCYLVGVRIILIWVYLHGIEFRYFFFHVLGFLLKVCQSVLWYVLLVFSPYKVLGKKRTIQILVSMSIFLVLNLHTCSTDLETWYLKASSVPKDNLTNHHCSFSPETENLLNIITWLWMRATCTFHRCSFFVWQRTN